MLVAWDSLVSQLLFFKSNSCFSKTTRNESTKSTRPKSSAVQDTIWKDTQIFPAKKHTTHQQFFIINTAHIQNIFVQYLVLISSVRGKQLDRITYFESPSSNKQYPASTRTPLCTCWLKITKSSKYLFTESKDYVNIFSLCCVKYLISTPLKIPSLDVIYSGLKQIFSRPPS